MSGGRRIVVIMRPCQGRNGGSIPLARSKSSIQILLPTTSADKVDVAQLKIAPSKGRFLR